MLAFLCNCVNKIVYGTGGAAGCDAGFALPAGRCDHVVDGFVEPALAVVLGLDHLEEGAFDAQLGHRVQLAVRPDERVRQRGDLVQRLAFSSHAVLNPFKKQ